MEWVDALRALFEGNLHLALFLTILVCSIGLPLPEEAIFWASGYVAAKQGIDPWGVCATGLIGILVGDCVPYLIGRHVGHDLLKHRFFQRIFPPRVHDQCKDWFKRKGNRAVFIARFVPGLRTPAFMLAGASHMPILTFVLWDLLGALVSCPAAIWLAYAFGDRARAWIAQGNQSLLLIVLLAVGFSALRWLHRRPLADPEKAPRPGFVNKIAYRLVWSAAWLFTKVYFRLRVHRPERIPAHGRVILVANHASFMDPVILALCTPRFVQYLMYSTFYHSFAHPMFVLACTVSIDEKKYVTALKLGVEMLEQEACVGLFPEGAVSYDGRLLPFKEGALLLAQRSGAAVIPVTIKGSHDALPRGAWWPRPRKIDLFIGEPLSIPREAKREELRAALEHIQEEFNANLCFPVQARVEVGILLKP